MQQEHVCPDCGSSGTLHFVAQVGEKVCSNCAAVLHDLQIYEPTNVHEIAYALGAPQAYRASSSFLLQPTGPAARPFWSVDRQQSRRYNDLQRKPEVDARIRGTLNRLGYPGFFDQVDFLFQRARHESWKQRLSQPSFDDDAVHTQTQGSDQDLNPSSAASLPASLVAPRINWGMSSLLLATACCYAVLRRHGVRIDLATVANAAQLPFPKVRTAFRRLHLLVKGAVRDIKFAHPDAFVHRIVAFFFFNLAHKNASTLGTTVFKFLKPFQGAVPKPSGLANADPARLFRNTPFEAVEATAFDLCSFSWPNRSVSASTPAQLAAFAMVVFALEAHIKAPAPIFDIFRCTHAALEFDPSLIRSRITSTPHAAESDATFSRSAADHYRELCATLKLQAATIPWLSDAAPINRKRRPNQSSSCEPARIDVIVHGLDILDVWRSVPSKGSDIKEPEFKPSPAQDACGGLPAASQHRDDPDVFEEAQHAEREMDNDDIDCFLSGPLPPSPPKTEFPAMQNADQEMWPRIEQRLEAAGALSKTTANHPIDLLTDDQVDQMLFDTDELASLFRTDPAELEAFQRAKVATGDWPLQSDHQRDQDIAALARSLEAKPSSASKVRDARNDSKATTSVPTSAPKTRKSMSSSSTAAVSQTKTNTNTDANANTKMQSHSTSRPSKRVKSAAAASANVSLREQQDESDWSD